MQLSDALAGLHSRRPLLAAARRAPAAAEPVAVKHWEGLAHGFIGLRALDGTALADGDLFELSKRREADQQAPAQALSARSFAWLLCPVKDALPDRTSPR